MGKETYYFSHDYNARNDEKILELRSEYGAEGYGLFWMIIETMAENENGGIKSSFIGGLSLGYGVAKDRLKEIIDACLGIGLLYEEGDYLFSKRLLDHKEFRKSQSEYGTLGAQKRWGGHRGANGNSNAKERKGKKKKEIRGVDFSADKTEVVFNDGSSQKLGESELCRLQHNDLKPMDVIKS